MSLFDEMINDFNNGHMIAERNHFLNLL